LVTTSGLTKTYGSVQALAGASLSVRSGCTALLGENGAGKSTLIKLLLGLNAADGGSASVFGFDPATHGPAVRARVGYFPEHDCLPNDWQAQDFVRQMGEVRGLPPRVAVQRASDVLAQVGLAEERYRQIGGFSTGMKQRVKLAQALVHDPQLVLLDEPTNGLDPLGRDQMGINVLISSHLLADVQQVSDAVILLDRGRVAAQGGLRELLADTDTLQLELIEENAAFVARLQAAGLRLEGSGRELRIALTDDAVFDTVRDAAAESGAGLTRLKRGARSLEEVFLSGTGSGAEGAAP
jgi:ABC-2 type transport system ATP-binding protein